MGSNLIMFWCCVMYRVVTAFLITTWFVPEEFWQGPEVAHFLTFGYGHLTWEWVLGMHSYLYPMLIAGIYKLLHVLSLDTAETIAFAPRLIHALLGAVGDVYFVKWYLNTTNVWLVLRPTPDEMCVIRPTGSRAWPLLMILTNWFWMYCATRTLSNCLCLVLTIVALYLYPWVDKEMSKDFDGKIDEDFVGSQGSTYLWAVGSACIIHPSAFVVWAPLVVADLIRSKFFYCVVFRKLVPIALVFLTVSTLVDSYARNNFTVTYLNFICINLVKDIGTIYGVHPWYWYFLFGLPAVLGVQFIPLLLRCFWPYWPSFHSLLDRRLISSMFTSLCIFSLVPHKELLYLLPLLPVCLHLATSLMFLWSNFMDSVKMCWLTVGIIVCSVTPALYMGMTHQNGVGKLMTVLANASRCDPGNTDLLFLMPCHSTPLYSHLHVNVATKFLSCLPDFTGMEDYRDESDIFYEDPNEWLNENYPIGTQLPSHIIFFDILYPNIEGFLKIGDYALDCKLWHKGFYDKGGGANILVYRKQNIIPFKIPQLKLPVNTALIEVPTVGLSVIYFPRVIARTE